MNMHLFFKRLRRLGLLSLCTLFAGGVVLIFVGANVSGAPAEHPERIPRPADTEPEQRPFRYGYSLSVQAWLAIVGVGFGLISHGLNQAYLHFFDSWCSWQAEKDEGLDYARYLNSQPRAPVVYGFRGFPVWISIRYLLVIASIAASIGYKFGIVEVPIEAIKSVTRSDLWPDVPPLKALNGGAFTPWITDSPSSGGQAFLHETKGYLEPDGTEPPTEIFAVGLIEPVLYDLEATGYMYSREIVMVAELAEELGSFVMARDDTNPLQTETSNIEWVGMDSPGPAIVEYRILDPGKVQIQWAKAGDDPDDSGKQSVARRLTYTMRFAVAEVTRWLRTNRTPPVYEHWVEATLRDNGTTVEYGVSIIVRSAMAGWLSENPRLDYVWDRDQPFGPEDTSGSYLVSMREQLKIQLQYPYARITLSGSGVTGCYYTAAIVFIALGCIAIAVAFARILLGPPALTSWMAQHAYLASTWATAVDGDFNRLAKGYEPARKGIGRLKLVNDPADGDGG